MISLRKALQAIYYLQEGNENPDKYNIMYLLKMLYFADRYHVRHFGILASGDTYKAMRNGPVAYYIYNNMKGNARGINSAEISLLSDIQEVDEYSISVKKQDRDELSSSYIKSLEFAIRTYGHLNHIALSEITHDYPEWQKREVEKNEEICIKDFFENPKDLRYSKKYGIASDPFADDEDFLQAMKEDFNETSL